MVSYYIASVKLLSSVPGLRFKQRSVQFFFFSSRRRHTRLQGDWSSDVCSSDLRASPAYLNVINRGASRSETTINVYANRSSVRVMPAATFVRGESTTREARRGEIGRASCRERV